MQQSRLPLVTLSQQIALVTSDIPVTAPHLNTIAQGGTVDHIITVTVTAELKHLSATELLPKSIDNGIGSAASSSHGEDVGNHSSPMSNLRESRYVRPAAHNISAFVTQGPSKCRVSGPASSPSVFGSQEKALPGTTCRYHTRGILSARQRPAAWSGTPPAH